MPQTAFALGSGYPFRVTRHWHWRVDRAESADSKFKLLTAYDGRTEDFLAWLAIEQERSSMLLARYEFHGTHPGWHCHAPCDDVETGDLGALRTRGCSRLPEARNPHRSQEFDVTSEDRALARSFRFYHVESGEDGALI